MRKVVNRECRFVVHRPAGKNMTDDYHLVKEVLHYDDGTTKPNLRLIRNYERPFWVTKQKYRDHKEKKEWEDQEKLELFTSTQSDLAKKISRVLKAPHTQRTLRDLSISPYLYGSDITSSSLIKHSYMVKNPDKITPYTMAAFDIETNVRGDNDGSIAEIATASFGNKIFTTVTKDYLKDGKFNPFETRPHEECVIETAKRYLSDVLEKNGYEIEVKIVDREIDLYIECFRKLHEWMPDFLVIWNIDFEMTKIEEACKRAEYDIADLFTDPTLDKSIKYFNYKRGPTKKETASGKWVPINPSQQWHTVFCMASFYPIDAMSSYRFLRLGSAEEKNYKLDTILNKNKIGGKLKFSQADGLKEKQWHDYMQTNFKYEYIAYNIYDSLCLHELNEKTSDLSMKLPMYSEACDFAFFSSMTKRLGAIFHYEARGEKLVIGTVPPMEKEDKKRKETEEQLLASILEEAEKDDEDDDDEDDEQEDRVLSLKDWIVTLAAFKVDDNGMACIRNSTVRTNIRGAVFDADAVGAYPSCTMVCNVSKETTVREIISIKGVDEHTFRRQGINLLSGHVNAIDYCVQMMGLPEPEELLAAFTGT